MSNIIEARVRQKTDTLANWNANDLVLLGGEPAFVLSQDGQPVNFKLGDGTKTFAELPYWIQYDQAAYIPYTNTPTQQVAYTIVGEGTYGSINIPSGKMAVLSWDGTLWSINSEFDLPEQDLTSINDRLDSIEESVVPSINLIDKNLIVAKYWNSAGGHVSSLDFISYPKTPAKPSTQYVIQDVYPNSSSQKRVVFFNGDTVISSLNADSTVLQTFITPSNCTDIGINIANVTGIGNNPTNNQYANSVMLFEGSARMPYQPYGSFLDSSKLTEIPLSKIPVLTTDKIPSITSSKITDFQQSVSNNEDVLSNKNFIGNVEYHGANIFSTSNARAGSIASNGGFVSQDNWCHFLIPIPPSLIGKQISTSGHSTGTSTSLAHAYYTSEAYSSFITGSGVALTGASSYTSTVPAGATYMRGVMANVVNIGTSDAVAQSSSIAKSFMINEGSPLPWQPSYNSGYIDKSKIWGLGDVGNTDMYFEFNPTGYNGKERFVVYTGIKGSDNFIGFVIGRDYDMSELVYVDYFRIINANTYKLVSGAMVSQSQIALATGESEFVYRTSGKVDFTGGYHGDETVISCDFIVDGSILPLATAVSLKKINSFEYREKSYTHQSAATGNIVDPNHTIELEHSKVTSFKNGSYTTKNGLYRRSSETSGLPIQLLYHAISCIGKPYSMEVSNEFLDKATMTGGNLFFLERIGAREYLGKNTSTGFSSLATSKLILPSTKDEICKMSVWDRPSDTKYYREIRDITIDVGQALYSEMTVEFKN